MSNILASRRRFLVVSFAAGATMAAPARAFAALRPDAGRSLSLHNLHTGENVKADYFADGSYQPDALAALDTVLRDHRSGDVHPIDPKLFDMLYALRRELGSAKPFHIISGYRSPKTNAKLAAKSGGVAKKSLHMQGKAMDIRLPGRDIKDVHAAARSLQAGGVGLYTRSDFVHVDTGRVRYWGS